MSGFGGSSGDEVTLQPGPGSEQVYRCPMCHRLDWSSFAPMCNGTAHDAHPDVEADLVSQGLAGQIDYANRPNFF